MIRLYSSHPVLVDLRAKLEAAEAQAAKLAEALEELMAEADVPFTQDCPKAVAALAAYREGK